MKTSTIVRTAILFLIIVNIILDGIGIDIIQVDYQGVENAVEALVSAVVCVTAWWKNNSFSVPAQMADKVKELLTDETEMEEVIETLETYLKEKNNG